MSQIERLAYIDERIRDAGGIAVRDIARRFEVGDRQVHRDIEYLRDRLGAPIEWNKGARRYEYVEKWKGLEFADEKALLFYVFARAAAGTMAYVPLAEADALERLLELVPLGLRKAEQAIRYELPAFESADIGGLGLIVRSLAEGRCLDAGYVDADGRTSERRIEPLRLVNYEGAWYCVAFDQFRKELRTFRLSRFERLSLSRDRISARIEDDEIERFLDSSYGMFKGRGDKRADIRFYASAIPVVRDELWHRAQERSEGEDIRRGAYIELVLPVSRWDEILGRVLRFGADAEVAGPEEFRELWKAEIARMAERYIKGRLT
jgi:predicted DNA-binding transcriptional regulator YafY